MKLYDIPQIDAKMYLRDETDLWGFLQNGEYEPAETELVKSIVKPNMKCLDIGGNIGYYTILMAKLGAHVWTYEPEPSNFELLWKNIQTNFLDDGRVSIWQQAVTDDFGKSKLYLCDASHGMHRMFKSKHCDKAIDVETVSLNWEFSNIKIDFIKIDVEGSESQVISGIQDIIKNGKPKMLIEFHPPTLEEAGTDPEAIYEYLELMNYEIYLVPDIDNPISYDDLYKQTNNESGGRNILCLSK